MKTTLELPDDLVKELITFDADFEQIADVAPLRLTRLRRPSV